MLLQLVVVRLTDEYLKIAIANNDERIISIYMLHCSTELRNYHREQPG